MDVRFPLLSIASLAFLLFFGLQGDVELYSWEVGISIAPDEVKVMVDPVWVVWIDTEYIYSFGCNAMVYGNVMVVDEEFCDYAFDDPRPNPLRYEYIHIKQFRALGWFLWPMKYIVNIEPPSGGSLADMWLPPDWWVDRWRFVAIIHDKPF